MWQNGSNILNNAWSTTSSVPARCITDTKGRVKRLFGKWQQKGKAHLNRCNTHNPMRPQLVWDKWENGAHRLWRHAEKRALESTYSRLKAEV